MGCLKLTYYNPTLRVLEKNIFLEKAPLEKKGLRVKKRRSSSTYGFNGMEKDDEIKGKGNSVNYKYRMHDTRLGRFLSVDPLTPEYPFYSPYQFAGNKPTVAIDVEGLEEYIITRNWTKRNGGYDMSITMTYNRADKAGRRSVRNSNHGDPNRKADINVDGSYHHSEAESFIEGSIEFYFEVFVQDVYSSIFDARNDAINPSNNPSTYPKEDATLQQSIDNSSDNNFKGKALSWNGNNILFDGVYDNYSFNDATIMFDTDKYDVNEGGNLLINEVAQNLIENPELRIELSAHTSMSGGESSNQNLSLDRVMEVYDNLVQQLRDNGMSEEDISAKVSVSATGRTDAANQGQGENSDVGAERKVGMTYSVD